ncbi:hypothetical protein J1N35_038736 [Gossypium stocksii]|uniref:Uncharacterized protein n=1 Tax=Gossypium stocksii TaxID=47602 RepID=A0A9D3UMG0_9ROSI|nr:hypothetical protein J1N35_038736 [Gossypium stocksii]
MSPIRRVFTATSVKVKTRIVRCIFLSTCFGRKMDIGGTHFIFPKVSVELHLFYNSVYRLMGKLLWGQWEVPIEV